MSLTPAGARLRFEAVRAAIKQAGIPELDPPKDAPQVGIWLHDPDGNLINIRQEERRTIPTEPLLSYNGPGNATRVGLRGLPTFERADPRRRGHVLFFTPDPDAATRVPLTSWRLLCLCDAAPDVLDVLHDRRSVAPA
jgi:hypothetical protein